MNVDRVLIEIELSVEIGPDCKCQKDCLFYPVDEAVTHVSGLDVSVQSKKAAQCDSPFDRGKRIRVSKDILAIEVI